MKTKELAKLSLSTIDVAIDKIADGDASRTCCALDSASNYNSNYVRQWEEYNKGNHGTLNGLPAWWNKENTKKNKALRLTALAGFRKLVADAQKRTETRSIATLLKATLPHLKALEDDYSIWEPSRAGTVKALRKEIKRALKTN